MDPKDGVWLQSSPAVGYVEFPDWKLRDKLIEWGYAEEDPDGDGWDPPDGFRHLGVEPERLKWLRVQCGAGRVLKGCYVAREAGPSFFLTVDKGTPDDALGRAAGELFRISRVLPATLHFLRGVRWALEATGWDDDELGRWLGRVRRKTRRTKRSLKKALGAAELRAATPLPEGWSEPRKGWTLELDGLDEDSLAELTPRLQLGDFGW